jgi:hypothetical protein
MPTRTELERLAAMASALRPDWPARSVLTYLERDQSHRAYRDLAVALAFVAADPVTITPRRLSEVGPWWRLTLDAPDPLHGKKCAEHGLREPCRGCAADIKAAPRPLVPDVIDNKTRASGDRDE